MSDNVRRITGPKPASVKPLSENDVARRVALNVALDAVPIAVPADDSDRIILLNSLLGDIADAYRFGHKNITDEYQRLAAAARRILEDDLRGSAA